MENLPKWHVDVKAGDQMFHFRTDEAEEMAKFLGVEFINAEIVSDYLKKIDNKINKVEEKIIKEASSNSFDMGCKHKDAKEISGEKGGRRWKALVCKECGCINFQGRTKDGGVFWQGWKEKK